MARILVAECKQEVSSFNPVPSTLADFETLWGAAFLDYHRGLNSEMAGALEVFEARPDVKIVPAYSARSITSGGTLAAEDFTHLAIEFLALVKAAGPVDAIYYSLHGAMSAENESDPEGYLLAETRKIVGEQIPIVISLDLRALTLTLRMGMMSLLWLAIQLSGGKEALSRARRARPGCATLHRQTPRRRAGA